MGKYFGNEGKNNNNIHPSSVSNTVSSAVRPLEHIPVVQ